MSVQGDKISDLRRKRGIVRGQLTNFEKFVNSFGDSQISAKRKNELQLRLQTIHNLFKDFVKIQREIEDFVPESEIPQNLEYREQFDNIFYSSVAQANLLIKTCPDESDKSKATCSASTSIKLPTISLPSFDGSYDNWLEFRDTYISMIHNSKDLDNIQKFHYLRSSLTGNALQVIKSLEFSTDNYCIAWDLVENRYNNKKLLVHNHVKALFTMNAVTKE